MADMNSMSHYVSETNRFHMATGVIIIYFTIT